MGLRRRIGSPVVAIAVQLLWFAGAPGPAQAAEDCFARLSRLPLGTSVRLLRADQTRVSGRLAGLDSAAVAVLLQPSGAAAGTGLAVPLQDVRAVTFRAPPPLGSQRRWRLAVGGAVMGAILGALVDPPEDTDFMASSAAIGGWPVGLVIGGIAGTAAGVLLTTSADQTLECPPGPAH
jgi:hypothetical protein